MQRIIVFPKEFVGFMHVWEMSAFMQSWGQLVANLSLPGAILVLLWTVLGPTSSVLGPTWANQAPHGADLGRLEPQLRPSYRYLGTRWGHHGASLGSHEAILAPTWANQAPHGANQPRYGVDLAPTWGQFGSTWSCFGPSYPQFSVDIGPSWALKA